MDENIAKEKKRDLTRIINKLGSLLVAFSGGLDSAFLLALAYQILGHKVLAATASSVIHPTHEMEDARDFVREKGIHHIIFPSGEMGLPEFVSNDFNRCYHCKKHMFHCLFKIEKENSIKHVAHGANLDDLKDYRPGFKAAREAGSVAPLIDANLCKEEIRFLSKDMGLSIWDKRPFTCLATRIPYGSMITEKKLNMIDEAELFLLEQGFKVVRVRHHGSVARIETDRQGLENIMDIEIRNAIVKKFREVGFDHIAVDLEGYISGKMNRALVI